MLEMKRVIEETLKEFPGTPYEINDGLCEEFMQEVCRKVPEAEERCAEMFFDTYSTPPKYTGHVWIYYNGKHYDAECPKGVENWKDLPFYKRIEILDK